VSSVWRLDYSLLFDLCLQLTAWLFIPIRLVSSVWRLDYSFLFDLCLQLTAWLFIPIRLVSSVWRLDYSFLFDLCLQCDSWLTFLKLRIKIDLGVANLFYYIIFNVSQLCYFYPKQDICLLSIRPSSDAPVYSTTRCLNCHSPRHTFQYYWSANKFKTKKKILRWTTKMSTWWWTVALRGEIFISGVFSCTAVHYLLYSTNYKNSHVNSYVTFYYAGCTSEV
jgi:hypothetical protein